MWQVGTTTTTTESSPICTVTAVATGGVNAILTGRGREGYDVTPASPLGAQFVALSVKVRYLELLVPGPGAGHGPNLATGVWAGSLASGAACDIAASSCGGSPIGGAGAATTVSNLFRGAYFAYVGGAINMAWATWVKEVPYAANPALAAGLMRAYWQATVALASSPQGLSALSPVVYPLSLLPLSAVARASLRSVVTGTSGGCLSDIVAAYSSGSGAALSDYTAGSCNASAAGWAATQQALYSRAAGAAAAGFTAGFQARAATSGGGGLETPAVDVWVDLGALVYAVDTAAETVQRVFGMSTVATTAAGDNPALYWPYDRLGTWLLLPIASPNTVFSITAPPTPTPAASVTTSPAPTASTTSGASASATAAATQTPTPPQTPSVTSAASVTTSPAPTASTTSGASASVTAAATQTPTPTQTPVVVITLTITVSVPAAVAGKASSPEVLGNLTASLAAQLGVPASWITIRQQQSRQLRALAASSSVVWLAVISPPATGSAQTLGFIASLNTAVSGLTASTLAPALTNTFTAMAAAAGSTYAASDFGVTSLGVTNNAPAVAATTTAPVNVGAIVGGVVGGAAFVAIIVAATVLIVKHRAAAAATAESAAEAAAVAVPVPDAESAAKSVDAAAAPSTAEPVADRDPVPQDTAAADPAAPGIAIPAHVAAAAAFRPTAVV